MIVIHTNSDNVGAVKSSMFKAGMQHLVTLAALDIADDMDPEDNDASSMHFYTVWSSSSSKSSSECIWDAAKNAVFYWRKPGIS